MFPKMSAALAETAFKKASLIAEILLMVLSFLIQGFLTFQSLRLPSKKASPIAEILLTVSLLTVPGLLMVL